MNEFFSRIFVHINRNLSVLVKTAAAGILVRTALIHSRARCCRAETFAVTLAGVDRFKFRLLSGRHEMRVFFQILDNLFGNHFTLEPTQSALD